MNNILDKSLFLGELKRMLQENKNYPFAFTMNLIQGLVIFFILIFSISKLGSKEQLMGTLMWPLVTGAINSPYGRIGGDIGVGTFEKVFLSPKSLLKIIMIRSVADTTKTIPLILIVLTFIYLSIGSIPGLFVMLTSALSLYLSGLGIGIFFAGLLVRYKNIGALSGLVMMIALAIPVLPKIESSQFLYHLAELIIPFYAAGQLLQEGTFHFSNIFTVLSIFCNTIFIFISGIYLFNLFKNKAIKEGSIGKY